MSDRFTIHKSKSLLKVLVGLGLLGGLIFFVNPDQLLAAARSTNPGQLLLAFFVFSLQGLFDSFRLRLVFDDYGVDIFDCVKLYSVGLFFSNFAPGLLGSDLYQVLHMRSIRPGLLKPVSLMLYLRVSGLSVNIALALISLALTSSRWLESVEANSSGPKLLIWLVAGIAAVALMAASFTVTEGGRKLLRLLFSKSLLMFRELGRTLKSISAFQHIAVAFLGFVVVLTRVLALTLLVTAVGTSIPFNLVLLAVTITTLLLVIPISFAGLGFREASITAFFVAFGLTSQVSVLVAVVSRCFMWVLSLIGGVWYVLTALRSR